MAVSTYKHGVTWRDVPTSIKAPITADSGIPVAIGAAPLHLADSPAPLNAPRVYYTYEEAVAEMGFSYDWISYPLCEIIYCYFVLFNCGPVILVNVFDPAANMAAPVVPASMDIVNKQVVIAEPNVILSSIIVKDDAGAITYETPRDYSVAYNAESQPVIAIIPIAAAGTIPIDATTLKVGYTKTNPAIIDKTDIIGGVDGTTGKGTGLETVEDVFPLHRIVPGILLCPNFSQEPEVAAVMTAKAENINGCFRCVAYADIDSVAVIKPQDVQAWKNTNNFVSNRLAAFWPRVAIQEKNFWLSTQVAALTEWVDNKNANIPYETPSNKGLKMNRTIVGPVDDPDDMLFGKSYADMLNGQGVITTTNWIGGWVAWGSNMSLYPADSDPINRWLPIRRMHDFIGNSLVLTVWRNCDQPGNRRLIDTIVDSVNIWLNSLVAAGTLLGARVEFRHSENSTADLLNGHFTFHCFVASPVPAEHIEWLIEFDVNYLQTLFIPVSTQTPLAA